MEMNSMFTVPRMHEFLLARYCVIVIARYCVIVIIVIFTCHFLFMPCLE